MKIVGIDGSPRKDGNTEKLLKKVLGGAEEAGGAVEFLKLTDLTINFCQGCGACRATGECIMKDDMDRVVLSIQQSDVVVLGSPVYAWQAGCRQQGQEPRMIFFPRKRSWQEHILSGEV